MAEFSLHWTAHAEEDVERLSPKIRGQILDDLWTLPASPWPRGSRIKKLQGYVPPLYRLRAGDFRILYRVEGNAIKVLRIIPRSLLDRVLTSLR